MVSAWLASYKTNPDGITPRLDADRWGEVVNVRDYSATGDGSTNDTAAVQAAIDAAFGPASSPHGLDAFSNRPIYFPAGDYRVQTPAGKIRSITAITNSGLATASNYSTSGGSEIRLEVSSNTFETGEIVNVYGMTGSTELNKSAWGIVKEDATHIRLINTNFAWFGGTPSGGTVVGPALFLRGVLGAHIYGDSRMATSITTSTAGGSAVTTNGCGYGVIERIAFAGPNSNGGTGFCYDWDGTGPQSSQAMTFRDCAFGGDYGMSLGSAQAMCSETNFTNNHFTNCATAGLYVRNYNALQQTIIGGNFQSCGKGILVQSGSVPIIHGVGFQNFTGWDIYLINTVGDGCSIHGCRSESVNFLWMQGGNSAHVANCTQLNATAGVFCSAEGGSGVYPGSVCLDNNYSLNGIVSSNAEFFMRGNLFANTNPLSGINTSSAKVHSYDNVGKNPCTVANLPTPVACYIGLRMMVTDASAAASTSNFSATVGSGKTVTGGGSNKVPVWCDGSEWRVG